VSLLCCFLHFGLKTIAAKPRLKPQKCKAAVKFTASWLRGLVWHNQPSTKGQSPLLRYVVHLLHKKLYNSVEMLWLRCLPSVFVCNLLFLRCRLMICNGLVVQQIHNKSNQVEYVLMYAVITLLFFLIMANWHEALSSLLMVKIIFFWFEILTRYCLWLSYDDMLWQCANRPIIHLTEFILIILSVKKKCFCLCPPPPQT